MRKPVDTEGLDPAAAAEAELKADIEAEGEGILPHPDLPVLFMIAIKYWVIKEASNGEEDPNKVTYTCVSAPHCTGLRAREDSGLTLNFFLLVLQDYGPDPGHGIHHRSWCREQHCKS